MFPSKAAAGVISITNWQSGWPPPVGTRAALFAERIEARPQIGLRCRLAASMVKSIQFMGGVSGDRLHCVVPGVVTEWVFMFEDMVAAATSVRSSSLSDTTGRETRTEPARDCSLGGLVEDHLFPQT